MRKTHASVNEQARVLRLLREASLTLEARLEGPTLTVRDLLELTEGHLLTFDFPVQRPVELLVNDEHRFAGQVVSTGRKRGCQIEKIRPLQGKSSGDGGGGGTPGASG